MWSPFSKAIPLGRARPALRMWPAAVALSGRRSCRPGLHTGQGFAGGWRHVDELI